MSLATTQSFSVDETVSLLRNAVAENERTLQRAGNVVILTPDDAEDVIITADLHGHRANFERILQIADLDEHPGRHLVLQEVCHGGPTDPSGGCQSHLMLRDVAELKLKYPGRIHFLLSNHELSEVIDYPILKNGSFLTIGFRIGINYTYGDGWEPVYEAYKQFIASSPLAIFLSGDIFVSHSVPDQVDEIGFDTTVFQRRLSLEDLQMEGSVGRLVWGRDYRPENLQAFRNLVRAQYLINGHTPCKSGFVARDDIQIILDCCDNNATYLHLPMKYSFNFEELVSHISRLW